MSVSFSVYRGPKRRLIAIGKYPEEGSWNVMQGVEGKRLKSVSIPATKGVNHNSLVANYVTDEYVHLFDGMIDHYGRDLENASSTVHWEVSGIDSEAIRDSLRKLLVSPNIAALNVPIIDDLTGTTVTIGHQTFGITRYPASGCIDFDGHGAGTLHVNTCADLLSLIALTSNGFDMRFANHSGDSLTRSQVIERCAPRTSDYLSNAIIECGFAPLSLSLKAIGSKHVSF